MMTDDEAKELNEKVAAVMGWHLTGEHSKVKPELAIWTMPNGLSCFGLPDFARDPHALGYMVEWLDAANAKYTLTNQWAIIDGEYLGTGRGDTLTEAVCRAIIAYADQEKQK